MTIDEAIEILNQHIHHSPGLLYPDTKDAIKLGIEALKFFKEFQRVTGNDPDTLLQGETEE